MYFYRDLSVLLELSLTGENPSVSDNVLHRALEDIQVTWGGSKVTTEPKVKQMPLCDAEVGYIIAYTRKYLMTIFTINSTRCVSD